MEDILVSYVQDAHPTFEVLMYSFYLFAYCYPLPMEMNSNYT